MSNFGFSDPWMLLLAIPMAAAIAWGLRGSRSPLSRARMGIAFAAIGLFLLATLATVSGLYKQSESDARTVWVLVDQSISTGANAEKRLPDVLTRLKGTLGELDQIGIITFHNSAQIVLKPRLVSSIDSDFKLPPASPTDETWIVNAINLARASTPEGTTPLALVIADGYDSASRYGDDLARDVRLSNLPIFPLAVNSQPRPEVALSGCDVRVAGNANPEIAIDLSAYSTLAQTVRPEVRINGQSVTDKLRDSNGRLAADGTWKLVSGRNLLRLRIAPAKVSLSYLVEVSLASKNDTFTGNNAIKLNVKGEGDAQVLLIHGRRGPEPALAQALKKANLPVVQGGPAILPSDDAELARYQVLILSDVPATDFSHSQLELIARWTRNGGGLAMIGGQDSFAPGGYFETEVEEILPVTCDVTEKGRKRVPALLVVLDRSGSMSAMVGRYSKMELANEGCVKALKLIPPDSWFGMLSVDTSPNWPVKLQKITKENRQSMAAQARSNTPGGGGIYTDVAIREGIAALKSVNSVTKHLVLFSDGSDTERKKGVLEMAAKAFRDHEITISTICLGSGPDWPFLQELARVAGGRAFLVDDATKLPAIFSREAALSAGSFIREDAFRPYHGHPGLLTDGFSFENEDSPELLGYVGTTAKEEAHVWLWADEDKERPLLATWNVELGQSLAWMSDARDRWANNWLEWHKFNEIWQRWIGSLVPDPQFIQGVEPEWLMERSGPVLILTFYDAEGGPRQLDNPIAEVMLPDGSQHQAHVLPVGAGVYRVKFERRGSGLFSVAVRDRASEKAGKEILVARESRLFIPIEELIGRDSNIQLLKQLAAASGGKLLQSAAELASQDFEKTSYKVVPLESLIWIALGGLLVSITARRFPVIRRNDEQKRIKQEGERISEAREAFARVQQQLAKRRKPPQPVRSTISSTYAPVAPLISEQAAQSKPKQSKPVDTNQVVEGESLLSAMRKVRKELDERKK